MEKWIFGAREVCHRIVILRMSVSAGVRLNAINTLRNGHKPKPRLSPFLSTFLDIRSKLPRNRLYHRKIPWVIRHLNSASGRKYEKQTRDDVHFYRFQSAPSKWVI